MSRSAPARSAIVAVCRPCTSWVTWKPWISVVGRAQQGEDAVGHLLVGRRRGAASMWRHVLRAELRHARRRSVRRSRCRWRRAVGRCRSSVGSFVVDGQRSPTKRSGRPPREPATRTPGGRYGWARDGGLVEVDAEAGAVGDRDRAVLDGVGAERRAAAERGPRRRHRVRVLDGPDDRHARRRRGGWRRARSVRRTRGARPGRRSRRRSAAMRRASPMPPHVDASGCSTDACARVSDLEGVERCRRGARRRRWRPGSAAASCSMPARSFCGSGSSNHVTPRSCEAVGDLAARSAG